MHLAAHWQTHQPLCALFGRLALPQQLVHLLQDGRVELALGDHLKRRLCRVDALGDGPERVEDMLESLAFAQPAVDAISRSERGSACDRSNDEFLMAFWRLAPDSPVPDCKVTTLLG